MKLMNPKQPVRASWIREFGLRFDASPFLSGAVEARKTLETLTARKDELRTLTAGHNGGIYNGPQFVRNYVDDAEHGVRFLTSGSMLLADLSTLPYLSRRDAHSAKLSYLRLEPGMTLISCSGTIGRTMYCRPEMEGVWGSQDVMKVVPNDAKIPPGYLFAFLSSRFGLPIITASTYGSIIQHLEPHHLATLPVPRFGKKLEQQVHDLIQATSDLRSSASRHIRKTIASTVRTLGLSALPHHNVSAFGISEILASESRTRLDAFYHSEVAHFAEQAIHAGLFPVTPLRQVVKRLFKPPMFKRLWVEDGRHGRQFVSGSDAYRYSAEEVRYVSCKTPKFEEFILKQGWVVFQAAGQVYGLFGRPLFVSGWLEDIFCADDVYRIVPSTIEDGAYLFAFFGTAHGQVILKRQASGNSIPRIWDPHMAEVSVPWPDATTRNAVAQPIIEAHNWIEQARLSNRKAIALVESAIEGDS